MLGLWARLVLSGDGETLICVPSGVCGSPGGEEWESRVNSFSHTQTRTPVLCSVEVVLGWRSWVGREAGQARVLGEAIQVRTPGRFGFSPSNLHPAVRGMWRGHATSSWWRAAHSPAEQGPSVGPDMHTWQLPC